MTLFKMQVSNASVAPAEAHIPSRSRLVKSSGLLRLLILAIIVSLTADVGCGKRAAAPRGHAPAAHPSLTLLREFDRLRKIHTMHVALDIAPYDALDSSCP